MALLTHLKIKAKLALLLGLSAVALVVATIVAASVLHQRMIEDRIDSGPPRTHRRQVVAVEGRAVTLDAAVAPGAMAFGELTWMEGAVCGLSSPVIDAAGAVLTLAEMPPVLPALPALPLRVRLVEGCDKQLATCRTRFANAVNFRGEAHLPGNDLLTRYPGG